MLFMAICEDGGDKQAQRQSYLQPHLDYVELIDDKIAVAGPLKDNDSGDYCISIFVYQTETRDEAWMLLKKDPYYRAGIYERVQLQEFCPMIGSWIGHRKW